MSKLSLIPHTDETKLTALQARMESLSKISADYIVLLAGSTVIASLGLFLNSPAVIIGAMIVAPLMRPLMGLSLAVLTADTLLLIRALVALIGGTTFGVVIAGSLGLLLQSIALTPEILSRTHPNLLDLGVAIFAGAIGAYCHTNEELSDTIAGVAISVALVPPLSVVGIGLAFNDLAVWSGAALLYATNLVGITFAGALVFFVMGYSPLKQAKKGLAISVIAVLLLALPLGLSMRELILENALSMRIKAILRKTQTFKGVRLDKVEVKRFKEPMSVLATVVGSNQPISSHQVRLVQDFLSINTGIPIEFRLRIIPSTEVTSIELSGQSDKDEIVPTVKSHQSVKSEAIPTKFSNIELMTPGGQSAAKSEFSGIQVNEPVGQLPVVAPQIIEQTKASK